MMAGALLSSCQAQSNIEDARECAAVIHQSIRSQDYEAIYSNASERFQSVKSKDEYVAMMKAIQNEYGKLQQVREQGSATVLNTDAGKLEVLIFAVQFERVKATERLTFTRDSKGTMRLWMFELS
jgi:hypothetical protein